MKSMVKQTRTGILICGLNGSGKSTLGKALAEKLHFHFIDDEDLYFSKTDSGYVYASSRTRKEAEELLLNEINTYGNFVFASVKGDYGETVSSLFQYVVLIDAPKNIRIQRVKNRSFQKFGSRMLPGGDLYEQEKRFFDFVESRAENTALEWVQSLNCLIIRIDGTKPVTENVDYLTEQLKERLK